MNESLFTSNTPEWYTPRVIVDRVLCVLSAIDLDPCADPDRAIPAAQHYTIADDGLAQPWRGRVYMNPPYGSTIGKWIAKLIREYRSRSVTEAIALVPARTDTRWFAPFYDYPICFVRGRLRFSGHHNSAPFPSAVVYVGLNQAAFVGAFGDIGRIVGALTPLPCSIAL